MEAMSVNALVWAGILFCISQSAMFSGLNLALHGISCLRLEVEAHEDSSDAIRVFSNYVPMQKHCSVM